MSRGGVDHGSYDIQAKDQRWRWCFNSGISTCKMDIYGTIFIIYIGADRQISGINLIAYEGIIHF